MSDGLLGAQRNVWRSSLTSIEKLVLLAILDHWSETEPRPFPSAVRLGDWASLDERTVRRAVRSLAEKGAVTVVAATGRPHAYDLRPVFRGRLPRALCPGSTPGAPPTHPGRSAHPPRIVRPETPGAPPTEGTKEGTKGRNQGESARMRARPPLGVPVGFTPSDQHRELAAQLGVNLDLDVREWRGRNAGKLVADPDASLEAHLVGTAKRFSKPGPAAATPKPSLELRASQLKAEILEHYRKGRQPPSSLENEAVSNGVSTDWLDKQRAELNRKQSAEAAQ